MSISLITKKWLNIRFSDFFFLSNCRIEDLLQSNSVLEPYQRLKSSIKTIQPSIESYGYTVANTVMTIQVVKVIDSLNSGIEHGFVIDKDLNIHYIANHKKVPASDILPNKVNS